MPAAAAAALLVHHVDAGKITQSGVPLKIYRNRQEMIELLRQTLAGVLQVAMEYSPQNALPRVS